MRVTSGINGTDPVMDEPVPLTECLHPPFANSRSPKEGEPVDATTERIIKWQQERMQRKLQDEHRSAVKILTDLACLFIILAHSMF